jgi:hypothetical protein
MLAELHGKGGCLCQPAQEGMLRCPLIVRPTSEDAITGHLAFTLRILDPRNWLSDLLNAALGEERFRRQVYRKLQIELWVNKPRFPRKWLPWDEGSTQVDLEITWESPATTVYVEAKYGSGLSPRTCGDDGRSGFSSDQLSRCARVGLWECGYYREERLFERQRRDFVLIVLSPAGKHTLVQRYRDMRRLQSDLPSGHLLEAVPRTPFIGQVSYGLLRQILTRRLRFYTRPERQLIETLDEYLAFKSSTVPERTRRPSRMSLPLADGE